MLPKTLVENMLQLTALKSEVIQTAKVCKIIQSMY